MLQERGELSSVKNWVDTITQRRKKMYKKEKKKREMKKKRQLENNWNKKEL